MVRVGGIVRSLVGLGVASFLFYNVSIIFAHWYIAEFNLRWDALSTLTKFSIAHVWYVRLQFLILAIITVLFFQLLVLLGSEMKNRWIIVGSFFGSLAAMFALGVLIFPAGDAFYSELRIAFHALMSWLSVGSVVIMMMLFGWGLRNSIPRFTLVTSFFLGIEGVLILTTAIILNTGLPFLGYSEFAIGLGYYSWVVFIALVFEYVFDSPKNQNPANKAELW
jgi:hypothetical protein